MSSETYSYKCGAAQTFCQPDHTFEPGLFSDVELSYNADSELYPVVVVCTSEEGDGKKSTHVFMSVERLSNILFYACVSVSAEVRTLVSCFRGVVVITSA